MKIYSISSIYLIKYLRSKTFNQSEAEMIKQKIEELKADINKSKKVNVEVTVGDEEIKKKESNGMNPK